MLYTVCQGLRPSQRHAQVASSCRYSCHPKHKPKLLKKKNYWIYIFDYKGHNSWHTLYVIPDCQSSSWGHLERRRDRVAPDPYAVRHRSGGTSRLSWNPCQSWSASWKKPSESRRNRFQFHQHFTSSISVQMYFLRIFSNNSLAL